MFDEIVRQFKDPLVDEVAEQVKNFKTAHDAGSLTDDEFKELVDDATDVNNIIELSRNIERKAMVVEAFSAIKTVVGLLK